MSKDKKSMDDVLASIRRIIRTDPTAAPPDGTTLPPSGPLGDETARLVLEKLRRESGQGGDEGDLTGKPLSTSDDPDEAARAVLDHLRKQAEEQAKRGGGKTEAAAKAEKTKAEPAQAKTPPAKEVAPGIEETPDEPPEVASDADDVPVIEEADAEAEESGEEDAKASKKSARAKKAAEADDDDGGPQVLGHREDPEPAAELPQPAPAATKRPAETPVMIDEAALEATIRRVVRDELMGDMGRRITRNVVKLIQDEIAKSRLEDKK